MVKGPRPTARIGDVQPTEARPGATWWRAFEKIWGSTTFNPTQRALGEHSGGRFDSVDRKAGHWLYDPYAYLYVSDSLVTSLFEAHFGRIEKRSADGRPVLEYSSLAGYGMGLVQLQSTIEYFDLTQLSVRGALRCPADIVHSTSYPVCRDWAAFIRIRTGRRDVGLSWLSRLGNGEDRVYILFDDVKTGSGAPFLELGQWLFHSTIGLKILSPVLRDAEIVMLGAPSARP